VEFYDSESNKALGCKAPTPISGDEKFSEVKCSVSDGVIKLGFPLYSYVDNYPNCDGESDRRTKTIIGYSDFCYDIKNNCIVE
jgi:hypothetical protein